MDEWVQSFLVQDEKSIQAFDVLHTMSGTICYIQQKLLIILEEICASLPLKVCHQAGVGRSYLDMLTVSKSLLLILVTVLLIL